MNKILAKFHKSFLFLFSLMHFNPTGTWSTYLEPFGDFFRIVVLQTLLQQLCCSPVIYLF